MNQLDTAHDVRQLARDLHLLGPNPLDSILAFCQDRVATWLAEVNGVDSIRQLESLVARRLQMVFEEFTNDSELNEAIQKYTKQGEGAFAALKLSFDDATFGALIKRSTVADTAPDQYVAFIDCRREKGARRFFTRWHEIAHVLTLTPRIVLPAKRSTDHPIERLMDEIAAQIGFYDLLFRPILDRHSTNGMLTFDMIERVRSDYCSEASFQATAFACLRNLSTPAVYCEAELRLKADEQRQINPSQMTMFDGVGPQPKLRVSSSIPNPAAIKQRLRIVHQMRVPESSLIYRVFYEAAENGIASENLSAWEFSTGGNLGHRRVQIEARRLPDRVIALVQPADG